MRSVFVIAMSAFVALVHSSKKTANSANDTAHSMHIIVNKVVDELFTAWLKREHGASGSLQVPCLSSRRPTLHSLRPLRLSHKQPTLMRGALHDLKSAPFAMIELLARGLRFRRLHALNVQSNIFRLPLESSVFRPSAVHRVQSRGAHAVDIPPVTLVGGFLGAGKTTVLSHILRNRAGRKIAVLVNDIAAVNVDAATLRRRTVAVDGVEMVELENGCVCCGPGASELAPIVMSLIKQRSIGNSAAFDHVVIELSGVADPMNVQNNLRLGGVNVAHKVALVDASTFPSLYNSMSHIRERTDLAGGDAAAQDPCVVNRRVVELLLLQIESADVILVNKYDLASDDELRTTLAACRALNWHAKIVSTTYGNAELKDIFPFELSNAKKRHEKIACAEPGCTHSVHDHSHQHQNASVPCIEPTCANLGHDEPYSRGQAEKPSCTDPFCTDPAHHHIRGSVPNSAESLGFQTHIYRARRPFSHDRLLGLVHRWPLPQIEFLSIANIASPGADGLATIGDGFGTQKMRMRMLMSSGAHDEDSKDQTFANVLRSKGIVWFDTQHRMAAEWSHAGRHFQLPLGGAWWATLPREVMRAALSPSGIDSDVESIAYKAELANFASLSSDVDADGLRSFGDRRQEIVFIGTNLNSSAINAALDRCLLSDAEMQQYQEMWAWEDNLIARNNGPFRFGVGARVECNMGEKWAPGVVIKQYYREAHWLVDKWMPYQVHLDDDDLFLVPLDRDDYIRRVRAD